MIVSLMLDDGASKEQNSTFQKFTEKSPVIFLFILMVKIGRPHANFKLPGHHT
jgi:hypothetical protein